MSPCDQIEYNTQIFPELLIILGDHLHIHLETDIYRLRLHTMVIHGKQHGSDTATTHGVTTSPWKVSKHPDHNIVGRQRFVYWPSHTHALFDNFRLLIKYHFVPNDYPWPCAIHTPVILPLPSTYSPLVCAKYYHISVSRPITVQ